MNKNGALTRRTALGLIPAAAAATALSVTADLTMQSGTGLISWDDLSQAERSHAWAALKHERLPHADFRRLIDPLMERIQYLHWLRDRDENDTVALGLGHTDEEERDRRKKANDLWLTAHVQALRNGGRS